MAKIPEPVLITERDYLPALLKLLDHARSRIDIIAFSFAIGSASGRIDMKGAPFQIAQKLAQLKKKRGARLKIRLVLEGYRETETRNRVTAAFLKKAGIQVRYSSTHAKGFCVDGRYLLIGSTNLSNQSVMKNNETNLLIDSPETAAEFERYFEYHWKNGQHGGISLNPPMYADGDFLNILLEMIGTAKKTLEFSIYFFSLPPVERALAQAHQRGVKITGFINDHKTFALSYVRRTQATIKRLRAAGLTGLHFDHGRVFTHSKYLIKDRRELLLGTGNWLPEDVDTHPQLYVHIENASLAKKLAKHLAKQIKAAAAQE